MILSARKEYICPPAPSCHAGTLARHGGDTYFACFAGAREGAPDVSIYLFKKVGAIWSEGLMMSGGDGVPRWNPVLYSDGDVLRLWYKSGATIPGWRTFERYLARGAAWTAERELVPGDVGGRGPVRGKPVRLRDGGLLAPSSVETASEWNAFTDAFDGRQWTRGQCVPLDRARFGGKGVIQPALWESASGAHMLLRSTCGRLLRSDSADGGRSWSPARDSGLPNNNSAIDVCALEDGRLLLVLNPVEGDGAARTPLWLYLSDDDGETFSPLLLLENAPGEYSYPAIIAEGRSVFLSYTHKRTRMVYWEIELE